MGYYGSLVANTAVAKEASLPRVDRGILYFSDFVAPYWMFIPAFGLLVGAYLPLASAFRRAGGGARRLAALVALPTAGLLNACYIVFMGGDYIHARLLIAPFFAVCAPVAAVPLARRYVVALLVVPWALVCAATLRTTDGGQWTTPYYFSIEGHGALTPDNAALGPSGSSIHWYPRPAVYVQFASPQSITKLDVTPAPGVRGPVIATSWIGYVPFALGPNVQILDLFGLADPLAAHLRISVRGEISGHEKPLPTPWVAALLTAGGSSTDQLSSLQHQRPGYFAPITPVVSGHEFAVETAWARAALQCPAVKDLREAPSRSLTPGAFISNMVRSVARTTLRIPPNPEDAYHRFCGPGTPPQVRGAIDG